jgi:hypothetical protein
MADDLDSYDVQSVSSAPDITGLGGYHPDQRKKGRHHSEQQPKDSKDYIKTIARAAEASNEKLVQLKLPYRFCVYVEGEDIFIDLVVLDKDGKIINEKKKKISQQDFERLIEDVSQIEGLYVDKMA